MGACGSKQHEAGHDEQAAPRRTSKPTAHTEAEASPPPAKAASSEAAHDVSVTRQTVDTADVVLIPAPIQLPVGLQPPVNALIRQTSTKRSTGEETPLRGAAISKHVSLTYVDGAAASRGHPVAPLHTESVTSLAVTDTEGEVFSCSVDKTIVGYNWRSKAAGDKYTNHSKAVQRVVWSSRHRAVFSGSRDTTIRQWRGSSFKEVQAFRGHTLAVTGLLVHTAASSSFLVSGARDYSLRVWDVATGAQTGMRTVSRNVVTNLRWIAPHSLGGEGNAFVSASIQASPAVSPAAAIPASSVVGSPFDDSMASGGQTSPPGGLRADVGAGFDAHCLLQCSEESGAGVRVWDVRSMECVGMFGLGLAAGGQATLDACSDPEDANYFVSVTGRHHGLMDSGVGGAMMSPLSLPATHAAMPEWGGAPAPVASEIRLWDRRRVSSNDLLMASPNSAISSHCSSGTSPVMTLAAHDDSIHALTYLPSSAKHHGPRSIMLATASKDHTLKVWDLSAAVAGSAASESSGAAAASASLARGSSAVRCAASFSLSDKKYSTEFTALSLATRPMSDVLLGSMGVCSAGSSAAAAAASGDHYMMYSAGANGALHAWHWNAANSKLHLVGHTAPVSSTLRH